MFLEQFSKDKGQLGSIEVICGSMFSGKTEELIRRLNRALIARQKVEIFKPAVDKRYHEEKIVSHAEREIRSTPVVATSRSVLSVIPPEASSTAAPLGPSSTAATAPGS